MQCAGAQQKDSSNSVQPILEAVHKTPKQAHRDSIVFSKKLYFSDTAFSPHKATMHSLMVPGWGQVYNKQYWKVPLVYGALGITAGVFFFNLSYYQELRSAYAIRAAGILNNRGIDTMTNIGVPAELKIYPTNSIQLTRNQIRHNVDLSVLAFLIAWGVNVIDASVTAHLKQFDVSDDLSMKVRPTFNNLHQPGLSLTFNFRDKSKVPTLISK